LQFSLAKSKQTTKQSKEQLHQPKKNKSNSHSSSKPIQVVTKKQKINLFFTLRTTTEIQANLIFTFNQNFQITIDEHKT